MNCDLKGEETEAPREIKWLRSPMGQNPANPEQKSKFNLFKSTDLLQVKSSPTEFCA